MGLRQIIWGKSELNSGFGGEIKISIKFLIKREFISYRFSQCNRDNHRKQLLLSLLEGSLVCACQCPIELQCCHLTHRKQLEAAALAAALAAHQALLPLHPAASRRACPFSTAAVGSPRATPFATRRARWRRMQSCCVPFPHRHAQSTSSKLLCFCVPASAPGAPLYAMAPTPSSPWQTWLGRWGLELHSTGSKIWPYSIANKQTTLMFFNRPHPGCQSTP